MRALIFSVLVPSFLVISGIIMLLLGTEYGVLITGIGTIWLIVSFLIIYKDDEPETAGMGRGRKR